MSARAPSAPEPDDPVPPPARIEALVDAVHEALRAQPLATEHELLRRLEAAGHPEFDRRRLADPLGLFRTHFLLFHCLYRLRERLAAAGEASLEIHCLRIRLGPPEGRGDTLPGGHDPLRDFYLDLGHLRSTDADAVRALLEGFWREAARREARAEALAVLGLEDPVDDATIRDRYRRLARLHHPDRGGDGARLREINAAMDRLLRRR